MIVTEETFYCSQFKLKSLIRLKRAFYDNNNKKNYLLPFHDKCLKLNFVALTSGKWFDAFCNRYTTSYSKIVFMLL